jgi:hypothetical protein
MPEEVVEAPMQLVVIVQVELVELEELVYQILFQDLLLLTVVVEVVDLNREVVQQVELVVEELGEVSLQAQRLMQRLIRVVVEVVELMMVLQMPVVMEELV